MVIVFAELNLSVLAIGAGFCQHIPIYIVIVK